jgi:hypothetical protein
MYLLSNKIDNITYFFCQDRKWRIKENLTFGQDKSSVMVYNRPNNATTMGKRFVLRGIIKDFSVVEKSCVV